MTRVLRRVGVLLAAAAVLVAPGCLRANYGYELDADGGGRIELQIRFKDELIRSLEQLGLGDVVRGDVSVVEDQLDRLPAEWRERVEVESVEDGAGIDVSIQFDDLEQLDELRSVGDIGVPVVVRTADEWRVDVDFSSMVGAAGVLAPAADELTSSDLGSLLSDALGVLAGEPELVVRITMPGPITDADAAAEVDGRTATWTVDADAGGEGFVVSGTAPAGLLSASVGGAPLWALVVLGLVVLAAVVASVVARRRARARRAAATPVSTPSGPAPWAQAPPSAGATPPLGGAVPPLGGAVPPLGAWSAPVGPAPPTLPPLPVPSPTTPTAAPLDHPTTPPSAADVATTEVAPVEVASVPAATAPAVFDRTETIPTVPVGGWHPDPWGQATWRWWDGASWTEHTA